MLAASAALPISASCFSHADIQSFELNKNIVDDSGEGTTFYSWLGSKNNAKSSQIVSAYRKSSRKIHPDRNPGLEATERFARSNQAYKISRSPMKEHYDSYLRSGFPKFNPITEEWTYRRFRPNLVLAIVSFAVSFTAVEFVVHKVNAARQRKRIESIIADAQSVAKQNSKTPGVVTQITEVAVGPNVSTVHPSGDVYFFTEKVTTEAIAEPMWQDTQIGKLVLRVQDRLNGKAAGAAKTAPVSTESMSSAETEKAESKQAEAEKAEAEKQAEAKEREEKKKLKKGQAKRRPAGAGGKAKVF